MNEAYKTDTLVQHGKTYRVDWFHDYDAGAPWENSDCHGPVSEWTRRGKKPSEMILHSDRGAHRFYDFAQAVKLARRDGWNTAPYDWPSKGAQAAAAALVDFEYLRRWCTDQWHYCGIVVTLLDDEGEDTDITSSLWGVEDDGICSDHGPIIQDLIGDCEYQENRTAYPVNCCGV